MSQLQKAADYFYANPNRSRNSVASKFSVGNGNLYTLLKKQEADITIYNTIGEERLTAIDAWFSGNPGSVVNDAALAFGIQANTLRAAYRGQAIAARKVRLANGVLDADPVAEMREKCAKIAESVGGEHCAAVAAAIRSVEV